MINYSTFNTSDFVLDQAFVNWVQAETDNDFWQNFIAIHPHKAQEIQHAKMIILAAKTLPVQPLSEDSRAAMWQQVKQNMNEPGRVLPIGRRTGLGSQWFWAAAAIFLVVAGLGWYGLNKRLDREQHISERKNTSEPSTNIEKVNNTEKVMLVNMPDGSSVILQKNSRVSYASDFASGSKREVYLTGEAFFEVIKNDKKPFLVYSGDVITKVMGTSFRIQAYEGNGQVIVLVKTGKVAVFKQSDPDLEKKQNDNSLEGVVLTANQQITLNEKQPEVLQAQVEELPELPSVPELQSFEFDDTPVSKIFDMLEKTYGVQIQYDSQLLASCRITASLTGEPIKEKIQLICQGLGASYQIDNDKIIISSKGCK
jgi:transmembrane sensor